MTRQRPYKGGKSIAERIRDGQLRRESLLLSCIRCGWSWFRRSDKLPKVCPRCKSPYWNRPRTRGVS